MANINSTLMTLHSRCEPWRKWESSHMGCAPCSCDPASRALLVGERESERGAFTFPMCVCLRGCLSSKRTARNQTLMKKNVIRGLQENKCGVYFVILLYTSARAHKPAWNSCIYIYADTNKNENWHDEVVNVCEWANFEQKRKSLMRYCKSKIC